jgi:hypothetical protein
LERREEAKMHEVISAGKKNDQTKEYRREKWKRREENSIEQNTVT